MNGRRVFPSYSPTLDEQEFARNGIEVRESSIPGAGRGVFAKRALSRGERLGVYRGLVYADHEEYDSRYALTYGRKNIVGNNAYSNWTSYINDVVGSDNTVNCRFKDQSIVTTRAVHRGEELFIDYGPNYWCRLPPPPSATSTGSTQHDGSTSAGREPVGK